MKASANRPGSVVEYEATNEITLTLQLVIPIQQRPEPHFFAVGYDRNVIPLVARKFARSDDRSHLRESINRGDRYSVIAAYIQLERCLGGGCRLPILADYRLFAIQVGESEGGLQSPFAKGI